MSTKKITALTELAAAAAATDMLPVVDVSDTTDAASGTTKKITATNIAKGVGIGAGSTTAEPVAIDTSNGRLGVGVASPSITMDVRTSSSAQVAQFLSTDTGGVSGTAKVVAIQNDTATGSGTLVGLDVDITSASTTTKYPAIFTGGNVGIGTTAPSSSLHVVSTGTVAHMESIPGASSVGANLVFRKSRGSVAGATTIVADDDDLGGIYWDGADGNSYARGAIIRAQVDGTPGDGDMPTRLVFNTTPNGSETASERVRIDSTGNVLIGGTATPTSSVGNLCLFNGTAPAASVTNGVVLYAQDVSTSELKVRDEAGNIATLSPHNFDLLGDRSEDMAWSYSCKNAFVGKEIAVDMTKVIRALEKLTGEEYIKIRDIADSEKLDWATEEKRKEAEQKNRIDAYKERKAESDAYPTSSSTKAEVKAFLDEKDIDYEDATKAELFSKVPEKDEFTEAQPAAYVKKSKPSWIK